MGKPNPVLTIVVHPDFWELECVKAWRDAGHNVQQLNDPDLCTADMILGPNCHYFHPALVAHAEEALKWARKRRKQP